MTLDEALKSFTMRLPEEAGVPGKIIRLDERDRAALIRHLKQHGFDITRVLFDTR